MRVLCRAIDGHEVEGEVIGGEDFDPVTDICDLDSTFTVRCDDGSRFEVQGWLVRVAVLEPRWGSDPGSRDLLLGRRSALLGLRADNPLPFADHAVRRG